MEANESPRYFNEDGSEFNPDLIPTPDLCVSCKSHQTQDVEEEILCNLTRADQEGDAVFICFAYRPVSPATDRVAVLRERCRQAGVKYPKEGYGDGGGGANRFAS
jgi:hypothetical protein